eukprot:1158226-Pelagomonas_calceolata.AAC.1
MYTCALRPCSSAVHPDAHAPVGGCGHAVGCAQQGTRAGCAGVFMYELAKKQVQLKLVYYMPLNEHKQATVQGVQGAAACSAGKHTSEKVQPVPESK